MNALANETSPYLLQHAHNPVNWYPWGEEALQKALQEDKPIIVSIGYSTCHWCHVMERESFESKEIADIMNEHFVCIKVDREERPDVDNIYMEAIHAMGLRGGWPLNVFLMPDQTPFYGGTYFPPSQWKMLLLNIANAFKKNRDELLRSAREFAQFLNQSEISKYGLKPQNSPNTFAELEQMYQSLAKNFDRMHGGIDKAPKFPMPSIWRFLLMYAFLTKNQEAEKHLHLTLQKMAFGGIYDHLGGGFARYSTDAEWFVPHFEKMLYDNAQLLTLYAEAYHYSQNPIYKEVAYEIFGFIQNELEATEGGFFSALDADSEGEEGKYYVWKKRNLVEILGEDTELFCAYYNVLPQGNWEFANNILYKNLTDEEFAQKHQVPLQELQVKVKNWKTTLLEVRRKRVPPGRDDKILTSWNGLMIKGLLDAYKAFDDEEFLATALYHTEFLLAKLYNAQEGFLYHTFSYKTQEAKQKGFLEDYACTIEALLTLYQATFEKKYLRFAQKLTDYTLENFYDYTEGMFFYTDKNAEKLIARKKEIFDNVIPASNSMMAHNLYFLGILLEKQTYQDIALQMLSQAKKLLLKSTEFTAHWGLLFAYTLTPTAEVAIIGRNYKQAHRDLERYFYPNKVVAASTDADDEIPLLANRTALNHQATFYVCYNKTCQLPTNEVTEACKQLHKIMSNEK
ncbi:MAG: thioredoxin domain-containing protein [Raineya sp.]|nr:thioredoxin domain-containing protein [Raineya sp.]MDW8296200.1 thioredoxin domain-containing protein [Raineya sp.]